MSAQTGQTPEEERRAELWARARRMQAVVKGVRYGRAQVEERKAAGEER
ncbi:hypothetical protein ACF064_01460 [Streptomyces sp. NPDC015492]